MEYEASRRGRQRAAWNADRLQALRRHLGMTQRQLADELGMRQQTISEWETGVYQPRGASVRLLSLIAERAGFRYEAGDLNPGPSPTGEGEHGQGERA
jgi:DNA-binding transcriptional regulator YiaG